MKRYFKKSTFLFVTLFALLQLSAQLPVENNLGWNVELMDSASWSLILIPDPQAYVKFERNQPIMDIITTWIKTNKDKLNIELVMCVGDIVDSNNNLVPEPKYGGDQHAWQQWSAISRSFEKLDNVVPYILCVGNHDMEMSPYRYSQFNSWFSPNRNPLTQNLLVEMFTNAVGVKTMENACYEFISPHNVPFVIFSLEFIPRYTIVEQAVKITQQEKYRNYKGIILTHTYLNSDNSREIKTGYPLEGATGEEIWQKLIEPSSNIEMLFCGHKAGFSHRDHVGYRFDKNAGDKNVHQILFNAQWEGGGPNGNGGDGWIRILEFFPDKKRVLIRTFSPLLSLIPYTVDKAFRTEEYDQFYIELD